MTAPVLIDPDELAERMAGDDPPALLDVRWSLGRTDGMQRYLAGHIPGAVYVDLETELAAPGSPEKGRHPLPEPDGLQRAARGWGVRRGQGVVVYDGAGNLASARAWWLLRDAGLDVRLLDGALAAWTDSGRSLETGEVQVEAGDVELTPGRLPVLSADDVLDFPGVLLDARAAERYRGETEPIDPRAGHIPGAISTPTTENLDEEGRFLEADALRERFVRAGVTDAVATYCGSGITAAHNAVALTLAGYSPALYPGSWSQWSHRDDLPIATGEGR